MTPAKANDFTTPLAPPTSAHRSFQYLNPILSLPIPPAKIAIVTVRRGEREIAFLNKTQNAISPYHISKYRVLEMKDMMPII